MASESTLKILLKRISLESIPDFSVDDLSNQLLLALYEADYPDYGFTIDSAIGYGTLKRAFNEQESLSPEYDEMLMQLAEAFSYLFTQGYVAMSTQIAGRRHDIYPQRFFVTSAGCDKAKELQEFSD